MSTWRNGGTGGTECTSQRVGGNRRCQRDGKRDVCWDTCVGSVGFYPCTARHILYPCTPPGFHLCPNQQRPWFWRWRHWCNHSYLCASRWYTCVHPVTISPNTTYRDVIRNVICMISHANVGWANEKCRFIWMAAVSLVLIGSRWNLVHLGLRYKLKCGKIFTLFDCLKLVKCKKVLSLLPWICCWLGLFCWRRGIISHQFRAPTLPVYFSSTVCKYKNSNK
jgi:hypothetical protein